MACTDYIDGDNAPPIKASCPHGLGEPKPVLDVMTKDKAAIRLYESLRWAFVAHFVHAHSDGLREPAVVYRGRLPPFAHPNCPPQLRPANRRLGQGERVNAQPQRASPVASASPPGEPGPAPDSGVAPPPILPWE
jgi:hypothetical protein